MNLSGSAVSRIRQFYQVDAADVLVVVDDVGAAAGAVAGAARGSAGGHNGLKSLIEQLGTASSRGCASASDEGTSGAIWPITSCRRSTPTNGKRFRRPCCGPPMPRRCSSPRASSV